MINVIVGALLGVCFFIVPVLAYREGIRIGMMINKGEELPKVNTPIESVKKTIQEVKVIKKEHEQEKADKKYNEQLAKLMSYNGEVNDET